MGGYNAKNVTKRSNQSLRNIQRRANSATNPYISEALNSYSSGGMSLEDALADIERRTSERRSGVAADVAGKKAKLQKELKKYSGGDLYSKLMSERLKGKMSKLDRNMAGDAKQTDVNELQQMFKEQILSDPMAAQRYASEQLQSDPTTSQMFGADGMLQNELRDLNQSGFGLTQQDREAYGQISGDIARQFGAQEQDLAQALASRGLAAAPSGAAAVEFSGLAGNKHEQLAKAQMQIAQQRYDKTLQRRQQAMQMQQLGQNIKGDIFGQGMQGRQQRTNEQATAAGLKDQNTKLQQDQLNMAFQQREQTDSPGLGEILGGAATGVLGAATGGIGAAAGAGLGSTLFGGSDTQKSKKGLI